MDENYDPIAKIRDRINRLYQEISASQGPSAESVEEAFQQAIVLLDELSTSDEELRQSNEELVDTQEKLEQERQRYIELFEFAPDAYLLTDLAGVIVAANFAAGEMLKARRDYLAGKPLSLYIPHEQQQHFFQILSGKDSHSPVELDVLARSGATIVTQVKISLVGDRGIARKHLLWLFRDITVEKQAQSELTESHHRLLTSVENERLRLAQELHDGPMQDLYAAAFKIEDAIQKTSDPKVLAIIQETQEIMKKVASALRATCGELRPPTLMQMGLDRAIESHVERLQEQQAKPDWVLNLDRDAHKLPQEIKIGLFRVYQQCATNIVRHAKATHAQVTLLIDDHHAMLEIKDDGVGFTPPEKWVELLRRDHFGLADVAERVQSMGGDMDLKTAPGAGTRVWVRVPVRKMEE